MKIEDPAYIAVIRTIRGDIVTVHLTNFQDAIKYLSNIVNLATLISLTINDIQK